VVARESKRFAARIADRRRKTIYFSGAAEDDSVRREARLSRPNPHEAKTMNSGNRTVARPEHDLSPLPLSRPLAARGVPAEGLDVVVTPSAEELRKLAQANGLVAVRSLEARLRVTRSGKEELLVKGRLRAQIRQTCVVSLEEFDAALDEEVRVRFAPPPPEAGGGGKTAEPDTISLDRALDLDDDGPDPLIGGAVDLGGVVCEFFTLGLDPYPRRPGASFAEPAAATVEEGPFAALAKRVKPGEEEGGD